MHTGFGTSGLLFTKIKIQVNRVGYRGVMWKIVLNRRNNYIFKIKAIPEIRSGREFAKVN